MAGTAGDGEAASAAGDAWQQAQKKTLAPEAGQSPHHPRDDVTLCTHVDVRDCSMHACTCEPTR